MRQPGKGLAGEAKALGRKALALVPWAAGAAAVAIGGWWLYSQYAAGSLSASAGASAASLASGQTGSGSGGLVVGGGSPTVTAGTAPASSGSGNDAGIAAAIAGQSSALTALANALSSALAAGQAAAAGGQTVGGAVGQSGSQTTPATVAGSAGLGVTPVASESASQPVLRAQAAGYATPSAYDAALASGAAKPAPSSGHVVGQTPAGQPLYTAQFGVGTAADPLDFSALSAAAIGGSAAARKTLAGQGYKLIPSPVPNAEQPYVVVPA